MLTIENYFKKIKEVDTSILPDNLKGYVDMIEELTEHHTSWKYYHADEGTKTMVDKYLKALNNFLSKTKGSSGGVTESQAREAVKSFYRPYVHRGDSFEHIKSGHMGVGNGDYTISSQGNKTHITELKGKAVDFTFPLHSIYNELKEEIEKTQKHPEKEKHKKEPIPKKQKQAERNKPAPVRVSVKEGKQVERIDEEVKFIKRFVLMHNKPKTKQQILHFINALQRSIVEKRIRKTSPYAKDIMQIQKNLVTMFNDLKEGESITLEIAPKRLENYLQIAGSEKIRLSIQYLKRYIGIHGKNITKEKAEALQRIINRNIEKGNIKATDPYYDRLKKVQASLKQFTSVARKGDTVEVHEAVLNGLNEAMLGCCCQDKMSLNGLGAVDVLEPKQEDDGVMTVEEARNINYQPVPISGQWLQLIGRFCLPTHFFVHGLGGSGKTSWVLLFTQYLSTLGYKILYVAGEQYNTPTMTDLLNRLNIYAGDNFKIVEDLSVLNPKDFDFVVLDSKDYLDVDVDRFKQLMDSYPKQSFIVLSQATKNGNFTGSERWRNIVDVMVLADRGTIYTGHDKNRWGGAGTMKVF